MPGIAGLISKQPPDRCRRLVEQMVASMQHEKFYVSGVHDAPDLGVYAGWVALEGSPAQFQPVASERGDVTLLFAGEFFSDRPLHKDVSWLLRDYEKHGDSFVANLNGLFSGLLIDRSDRKSVV